MCDHCGNPDCVGTPKKAVENAIEILTKMHEAGDDDNAELTLGQAVEDISTVIRQLAYVLAAFTQNDPAACLAAVLGQMVAIEMQLQEEATRELRENAQWN